MRFQISETDDYEALIKLFIENRLEFSEEELAPEDVIKCWQLTQDDEHELIGGLALVKRGGEFIIEGIAVKEQYRRYDRGKQLLGKAIEEVRRLEGRRILLVARAPGFFRKSGFTPISEAEAPGLFDCYTCPQYGKECHPEVMKLELDRSSLR